MTASRGLSAATNAWISQAPLVPCSPVNPPAGEQCPSAPSGRERGLENGTDEKSLPGGAPQVIGLDTSLTKTGVASSDMWCEVRGYKDITTMPHARRIATMLRLVDDVLDITGKPDLVVIEAPAFSRTAGGAHERAFLFWRLYEALTGLDVPIAVMTTNQRMLYATGKGSANKGAIVDAVARRLPQFDTGGDDNKADAVILMAAGRDALGHPLVTMPAAHRRALEAVAWPTIGGAS